MKSTAAIENANNRIEAHILTHGEVPEQIEVSPSVFSGLWKSDSLDEQYDGAYFYKSVQVVPTKTSPTFGSFGVRVSQEPPSAKDIDAYCGGETDEIADIEVAEFFIVMPDGKEYQKRYGRMLREGQPTNPFERAAEVFESAAKFMKRQAEKHKEAA